jgi:anti-sigma regulatory factor (Ser/Thr protein kinase)
LISIAVTEVSQVAEARRQCIKVARSVSFSESDTGRIALVATELASNLVKHGRGGEILVGAFEDPTGKGVEVLAMDKGPGMASIGESLRDGHSTAGTSGTGLGAVRRQSQTHEVFSSPGSGTVVLARLQAGRVASGEAAAPPPWGAICLPKPGEEANGDGWAAATLLGIGHVLLVADGLGHGPGAADASAQAVRIFTKRASDTPGAIVQAIHDGLRSTRGAAVAVARVDVARGAVVYAGIGNITGVLVDGAALRRMVSHNGTAGHSVQRIKEFEYPFRREERGVIILHSDGIGGGWALNRYPGLGAAHPTLTAAVLYRDFNRGRDDATVLVARTGDAP